MASGKAVPAQTLVDAHTSVTPTSRGLADLLTYLNPPQQQYGLLADGAARLLTQLPPEPSLMRALTGYFQLFARGYAIWQTSYHYHTVHEYFYGAYLLARDEGGDTLSQSMREMLEKFTDAMIAYTLCENAIISNNPLRLRDAAQRAKQSATAALELSRTLHLESLIGPSLETYMETNIALFRGLELCAEVHLHPEQFQHDPAWDTSLQTSLALLQANSYELYSELRAHYTFAARYANVVSQDSSRLRIGRLELVLRAIGYIGEELLEALFAQDLSTPGDHERLVQHACRATGLPIKAIRQSVLQDIFETSLGEEYLNQLVVDLDMDDDALSFDVCDGSTERAYSLDSLQIRVARFGSISVEFTISSEDASVSHMRVLESLIAPHAGRFAFVWRNAPTYTSRSTVDYIEMYMGAQAWYEQVRAASDTQAPQVLQMEIALRDWHESLVELSRYLREYSPTSRAADETDGATTENEKRNSTRHKMVYTKLEACAQRMSAVAHDWTGDAANRALPQFAELSQAADSLFPQGKVFGYLRDIAEEIFECIARFLNALLPQRSRTPTPYIRTLDVIPDMQLPCVVTFDSNTGWQTLISCDQMGVTGPGETLDMSWQASDIRRMQDHRDFKGLIIQNREARASLDDWLFVSLPTYTNLATIRSHETDFMVVSENRVLLCLPDDPQYLLAQYTASAAIVGDIRTIVLAYNLAAKAQLLAVEEARRSLTVLSQGLKVSRDRLLQQRQRIEVFRMRVDQFLDLMRSYTISKYQDHSDLMKAMIRDGGVESLTTSLVRNIELLDHFHTYVTELIHHEIEERNQSNQTVITWLLLILSLLSGLSAIDPIASFAGNFLGAANQHLIEIVLFCAIVLIVCIGGILIWLRSRKH